jgi:hypothetical protein
VRVSSATAAIESRLDPGDEGVYSSSRHADPRHDPTRLVASEPTEHVVAALREHGAVIVEGVLAPDLPARFNAEIAPILEQVNPYRSCLNPAIDFFYGNRGLGTVDLLDPIELLAQGKLGRRAGDLPPDCHQMTPHPRQEC